MTNDGLILATIKAQLDKDWRLYAELKKEFFRRLTAENSCELAELAQDLAHEKGLATF